MKKLILTFATMLSAVAGYAQFTGSPAFPGAEGHGRYVTGGRGGVVKHVTNLNDSGTGSFREAVKGTAKKIVVFDVSGYIDLKSDVTIGSNTTIAGQTAPGDGITLRYRTLLFTGCDNVICRYIRCRRSQVMDINDGADATWGRNKKNIIIDHCSFSWSIDEIASFYDNRNFTMQWCTLGEALANPGHSKGEHSYGGIWGGKEASFHHNLLLHMQNRVPRFNGARYNWNGFDTSKYANTIQAEQVDFRNCVMYNWGTGNGCYGGPGGGYINMVNNYYKAGPATKNKTTVTQVSVATSGNSENTPYIGYASRYFIKGNYVSAGGTKADNYDWTGVKYDSGLYQLNGDYYIADDKILYGDSVQHVTISGKQCVRLRLDGPSDPGSVTTHTAKTAFDKVVEFAGASFVRDAIDARYADETRNGTTTYRGTVTQLAGIIDLINDPSKEANPKLVSYPDLREETRPADFDTDGDGMPDAWELANGLNPNNAKDGTYFGLDEKGYYTNLEVYLNSIVEDLVKQQNANAESSFEEYYPKWNNIDSGITNLSMAPANDGACYNISGQRVSPDTKGIIITNGRKIIVK